MRKFYRKNQTSFLLTAILFLGMSVFVSVTIHNKKIQANPAEEAKAINNEVKTVEDNRKEVFVPILMYHHVRDYNKPEDTIGTNLSVSPENFQNQIDYLKNNNFTTITFEDFMAFPTQALPEKPVIITFDDGYADVYNNAYKQLKNNGQVGVFFVIAKYINQSDYLSIDNIQEIAKSGMEIGSHSVNHPNLTIVNQEKRNFELTKSKSELENIVGKTVSSFCYPSGNYNDEVAEDVRKSGYLIATTTKIGTSSTSADKITLPRQRINSSDGINTFIKKLKNN